MRTGLQAAFHRLQAARQIASGLEGLGFGVGGSAPLYGLGGLFQSVLEGLDGLRGLVLEGLGVFFLSGAPHQVARVEQPFAQLGLANRGAGVLQLVGSVRPVAAGGGGQLVEFGQELADLLRHLGLGLDDAIGLAPRWAIRTPHRVHAVLDIFLLLGEFLNSLARVVQIALQAVVLHALQLVAHVAQATQCRLGLGDAGVASLRGRPAHRVGDLLQLPRHLLELPLTRLAGEAFQLAGGLLGLLGEIARRLAAASALPALLRRGAPALPFKLLFLAPGQLAQLFQRFVDGLVGGLLLAPLHGLVLVTQRVGLQLEQVGQILGAGTLLPLAPAAALLLLFLRHEALVRLLGLLQLPERALLGCQRALQVQRPQRIHRLVHGFHGDRERLGDALEGLVGPGDSPVHDPLGQRLHLFAQPLLGERDADHVFFPHVGRVAVAVAHQVEAGRDDLPLQRGQILVHAAATAAAPTPTPAALGLAVLAFEGAHLQKVDVRQGLVRQRCVVARDRVVGDEVPRLQLIVLHEHCVARGHGRHRRSRRAMKPHRVGRAAVDVVDQQDLGHAQVVVGAGLEEHLLDGADRDVAPGFREGDRRALVAEDIDAVVGGARDPQSVAGEELDAVKTPLPYGEGSRPGALRPGFHGDRVSRVHHHQGAGRGDGRGHGQLDPRPAQRGHVATVLEAARFEAGVAREVVDHLEAVHRGQVRDAQGEGLGAHARGLDVVGGLFRDVEQEPLERPRAVLDHGHGHEAARPLLLRVEDDVVGDEAAQRGRDPQVGVA